MGKVRAKVIIKGIVQGVGFRPFIHKAVENAGLCGWVRNTSDGAELELEGERARILGLVGLIKNDPPELAYIESVDCRFLEGTAGYHGFAIEKSLTFSKRNTLISPDVCTCPECLAELFDKNDRRYRYPFINCTNCGPRFTIIRDVPYDREKTTMSSFPMCRECAAEYSDIKTRRYHAQPDCCGVCGPRLSYTDKEGTVYENCIERAADDLKKGRIVAIKGIGGFHLACKPEEESAGLLRERKHRDGRPFALMCKDIEAAEKLAYISEEEKKLLLGKARPIVLLKKRENSVPESVSSNSRVGIMLPYTPLHFLLFEHAPEALVMTSANLSDRPIIYKNEEALQLLDGIADAFLMHNRDIQTRCDDSVVFEHKGKPYFVRRSRGYVPLPLFLPGPEDKKILACGAEQKAGFSLYSGGHLFTSPHIGDLKNAETLDFYEEQIAHFENLFDIKPGICVCDLHPDYLSSRYAKERAEKEGLKLIRVQHHFAHMAACMADNSLSEKCIGIIWDGTGAGTDGTVWGAEFLYGDLRGYERLGSILPIPLPGGDVCTKEVFRTAWSLCRTAGEEYKCGLDETLEKMLAADINCPKASSMGRLFDGVSALTGICRNSSYEGEGAVQLEAAADAWLSGERKRGAEEEKNAGKALKTDQGSAGRETEEKGSSFIPDGIKEYTIRMVPEEICRFDWREMIRQIRTDVQKGTEPGKIAYRFIYTLACMAVRMCVMIKEKTGCADVVLSGGTFQNMLLLQLIPEMLAKEDFKVCTHSRISANDEGISAGQAAAVLAGFGGDSL